MRLTLANLFLGGCTPGIVGTRDSSGDWTTYPDGLDAFPVRGGSGGTTEEEAACSDGGFIRLDVQYGAHVDRLTMHCHDLTVREGPG